MVPDVNLLNEVGDNEVTIETSHSTEGRDIAAIGISVGFQIDANDPVLAETKADSGEKIVIP